MTGDHCDIQAQLRVAEVSLPLADEALAYEPLGAAALADRLGVCRRQAERVLAQLRAAQHHPEALRVVLIPVSTAKGARREALHVLWPRAAT